MMNQLHSKNNKRAVNQSSHLAPIFNKRVKKTIIIDLSKDDNDANIDLNIDDDPNIALILKDIIPQKSKIWKKVDGSIIGEGIKS